MEQIVADEVHLFERFALQFGKVGYTHYGIFLRALAESGIYLLRYRERILTVQPGRERVPREVTRQSGTAGYHDAVLFCLFTVCHHAPPLSFFICSLI